MPVDNDKGLRAHLLYLLKGGAAHPGLEAAIEGLAVAMGGRRPQGAAHSPWEILEHMRLTQWDILEFSRDPKHVSPEWPAGYWIAAELEDVPLGQTHVLQDFPRRVGRA